MLVKEISYIDLNGQEQKEKHYFNFNRAELVKWDANCDGGLQKHIEEMVGRQDPKEIFQFFDELILGAYGVKSEDDKRFVKSDKLREEFKQTEAYSELFMELLNNEEAMNEFINAVIPKA